jgi:hypothetical protein
LPVICQAFSRGELSYCKVRALTRVATSQTEEDLAEIARHATGAQLEKLVRGYRGALRATLETARTAHERRFASLCWEDDGSLRLDARLTADEGALLMAALRAFEQEPNDETDAGAARADALVSVARAALKDGGASRTGGDPCEVVVHVDADSLQGDRVLSRCEVADGPALAPETMRRLACDAAVVRILERDGEPLSVGRRTRAIPPALRRALHSRDGGCRFPGCDHRRFLHAHHIEHWARGGRTDLGNLVQLCSHHHRLVHEGGFTVQHGAKGLLVFRRPDGRSIPGSTRLRADGPGLRRQHDARGLSVDADTCRPLSAGDTLDYQIAVTGLCARQARGSPEFSR